MDNNIKTALFLGIYSSITRKETNELALEDALKFLHDRGYLEQEDQTAIYARRILWEYENFIKELGNIPKRYEPDKEELAKTYFGILLGLAYVKSE